MKWKIICFIVCSYMLFSCDTPQDTSTLEPKKPRVVEAIGRITPIDSLATPLAFEVNKSKLKTILAGVPKTYPASFNVLPAGIPKKMAVGSPKIFTPGKNGVALPVKVPAVNVSYTGKAPMIIDVNDASTKDQNPFSFSFFSAIHGLKSIIMSILEDQAGNLWLATWGGGVIKYDGKSFYHYNEKTGLSNNYVWSVLEDSHGNLWFGTNGGGVTKYDGKYFTRFGDKEGLSDNVVVCMLQDHNGNLWFGTDKKGVSMYDGTFFTHYTTKEGLAMNDVLSMVEDRSGNLWFGTEGGGVSKWDGNSFTQYTEKEGLCSNHIRSIVEDQKGDLWFGSLGGGVSQFDGKTFTHYTEKEGLSNNNVRSICEDQHGNIWIGTWGGGIDKFNGQAFSHYGEKEGLSNNYIRSILADKNGNLWIGTAGGGVNKFHGNAFTHFKKDQGLKNNIVRSILEDQSGKLWFGTWGDGISRYDGNTFMQYTLQEGLPSNFIVVSLEDKEGNLWFGTRGEGVIRYDGKYFTHFTENDGLSDNYVMSILEDRKGHLWFGTLEGGVTRYDGVSFTRISKKEGLSGNTVWSIIEDKEGNIWFSTWGGGVTKYNGTLFTHFSEKEGLFNNEIWSMLEDSRGNLWFGTNGSGVIKYDGHYFTQYTTREGLSNNVVRSILEDHENNLWFGTEMGLNKMSNRLSTGAFLGEQPQDTKELNNILFSFYNYEDGFMGLDCNPNALFEDSKNNLWIGTNDRLSMYQKPQGEIYLDTLTPNIQLTSIQLFNEDIPWLYLEENKDSNFLLENGVEIDQLKFSETSRWYGIPQQLQLPYDNNFLTFSFVGITTNSPKKVKYQYQLEGIDVNWITLTSRTEASYGNLSHGDYLFKVKARNSSGYFSKTYEYRFSISPPWWHTWWARFIFVIVPGLLFITFYRIRVTLLKNQKLTLEKQVKDRTTQLLQQNEDLRALNKEKDGILGIVAHDLRAPFQRIKGLLQLISYEGKFEKEQFDYVDKINMNIDQGNQIIRDLLDVSNYQRDSLYIEKDIVVIEDFLNELKEYFGPLAKSKQQPLKFISKATSLLNTDKILLFRVMENLVSNAIKFSPPGKPIQVTAWEEHTRFYFSIKDNGPGFSKEDKEKMFGKFQKLSAQPTGNEGSTGLGLSIVKIIVERLHGSVEVFSEPKKGAEFIVSLKKS